MRNKKVTSPGFDRGFAQLVGFVGAVLMLIVGAVFVYDVGFVAGRVGAGVASSLSLAVAIAALVMLGLSGRRPSANVE